METVSNATLDFLSTMYEVSIDKAKRIQELVYNVTRSDEYSNLASLIYADIDNHEIKQSIIDKFGEETGKKLELLKRISSISFPDTKKQILQLRKQFIGLVSDLNLIFIVLSERLIALKESIDNESSDLLKIAEECLYLYSPIAHRLGIRKIYTEMDDLSFQYLYPKEFKKLDNSIEKHRENLNSKLEDMKNNLNITLAKHSIEGKIQFRVKRLYSIYLKLINQNISIEDVYDLMALRVILKDVDSCYLALGAVHRNWIPIEKRFRDWITFPKANGYRSIQTTVVTRSGDRFEIQIRTDDMHREAEYGSAAHWAYKEGISADTWILRLKEFLENDEYFQNPYELQELMKSDLKTDNIHVLTPKGDVKSLKLGSTAIDFAYGIHTDIGEKLVGVKINGKLAKLKTPLNSGDVVEVITNPNATPSRDWLDLCQTSKARSKILLWIKKNEQAQILEDGKRLWERFKKRYKNKLEGHAEDAKFKTNLIKVGFKNMDDFYSAVAIKSLKLTQTLLRKLYPDAFAKSNDFGLQKSTNQALLNRAPKIKVEDKVGIITKLAKCCNPIKGEAIIAYVTSKSDIKIHAQRCKHYKLGEMDPERIKPAEWELTASLQQAVVNLFGENYFLMQKALTDVSSAMGVAINSMQRKDINDYMFGMKVSIEVKDLSQLNQFVNKLQSSADIESVDVV